MTFTELLFHSLWLAVFDKIFNVPLSLVRAKNVAYNTIECISLPSYYLKMSNFVAFTVIDILLTEFRNSVRLAEIMGPYP